MQAPSFPSTSPASCLHLQVNASPTFPFNFPCKLPSPISICKPHLSFHFLSAVSDSRFTPLLNQGKKLVSNLQTLKISNQLGSVSFCVGASEVM
ncbi:hypothetical protein Peur_049342 [Populus x canadensis]